MIRGYTSTNLRPITRQLYEKGGTKRAEKKKLLITLVKACEKGEL